MHSNRQKLSQALKLLDEFIAADQTDELFFENRFVRWQQSSQMVHDAEIAAGLLRRYFMEPPLPTTQAKAVEAS